MASRHRKYAELCFEAAERAPPKERKDLRAMAKVWLELAAEARLLRLDPPPIATNGQWTMFGKKMALNVWEDITIEYNGKVINGSYCVSDWMITVIMKGGGNISTKLGSASPKSSAKLLLRKLAQTTS